MKSLLYSIIVGAALGLIISGCGKTAESEVVVPEKNTELAVDVMAPVSGALIEELTYSGTISGAEESVVRARVSETIVDIPVSIGQMVEKGTILAQFDASTGSVQYDQAKASLELAQTTYDRYNNLLKAGAISQQMLDEMKVNLSVSEANFRAIKNLLFLEAPISGTVTAIHVNGGDFVGAGSAVATVSRLSSLKTSVSLNGNDLGKVKTGAPVLVSLTDDPSIQTEGTIYELAKAADPSTRTFEAKIRLSNQAGFRSGQFVGVKIRIANGKQTLLVPVSALTSKFGKQAVLVVNADSTVTSMPVETGYRTNDTVSILNGLQSSQLVVTSGTLLLKDGDKVIPRVQK